MVVVGAGPHFLLLVFAVANETMPLDSQVRVALLVLVPGARRYFLIQVRHFSPTAGSACGVAPSSRCEVGRSVARMAVPIIEALWIYES